LQSVCEEVLLEIHASHPDRTVRFESRGDVAGKWDADRLAQVVTNLVVNAIEHVETAPVTLAVNQSGDNMRLTVHNEGPPIPSDVQQKMFEPLARGRADGTHNIGLGLFIA
jgi:signal transduction histidine kinase